MRKMKNIRKGYIDGIISVYKNKDENQSSFNAVKNALEESDLIRIEKLRYNVESKRDSDLSFAEAHDRSLSLKISTPLRKTVEADQYAITNGILYALYNVDYDDHVEKMFLYLEEVRKL